MSFILAILGWFGGGPLKTIADALTKAHADSLNAKTVSEKTAADERVATLTVALADMANARQSARTFPLWISIPGGIIAFSFAIHIALIGIGTWWVAPHNWSPSCRCYVAGLSNSWWEWTTHIPLFPPPMDEGQLQFLAFLFGGGLVAGGFIGGAKAVAGAISRRK